MSAKDFRIFYDRNTHCYILTNDYKMRSLLDKGYSYQKAKDKSHGHLRKRQDAESLRDCILAQRKVKARDLYTLECVLRVTDKDYRHHEWTQQLYETKADKGKSKYINVNKGCR